MARTCEICKKKIAFWDVDYKTQGMSMHYQCREEFLREPEDDAGKQKYFDDYELRQDIYDKQVEHWEKETRKWREEKRCRLISEGIEVDNQKRMTLQLNPICECDLCCFDKDA